VKWPFHGALACVLSAGLSVSAHPGLWVAQRGILVEDATFFLVIARTCLFLDAIGRAFTSN